MTVPYTTANGGVCPHGYRTENCGICMTDDQVRHVYPTFGRKHVTNKRAACWCGPKVEFVEGGAIITHEVEQ